MAQQSSEIDDLRKQNSALLDKLKQYRALKEDLLTQRVYEKARKRLLTLLTLGGITAVIGGIFGIKSLDEYAKKLAQDELKVAMRDRMQIVLQTEVHSQISGLVQEQRAYVRRQVVIATQPLGTPGTGIAAPPGVAAVVDYTTEMLPVRNQGIEGSATGFAVSAVLEYQVHKISGESVRLSPRFLYNAARQREQNLAVDAGATLTDVVLVAKEEGAVPEAAWPYVAGQYAKTGPAGINIAKHYKAAKTTRLTNLAEIRSALANGPIVAGIAIYQSISQTQKDGIVPMPGVAEMFEGGYPICIIGYDDQRKLLKFESSWGPDWGSNGFGYISYEYAEKYLGTDNWAVAL